MIKKLLLTSLFLLGCSADRPSEFATLDGGRVDLQSPQKLVLINYWAVWCAPCRKEIPEFNKLQADHGDKVSIYAVNFDGSQGDLLRSEKLSWALSSPVCWQIPGLFGGWKQCRYYLRLWLLAQRASCCSG